MPKSRKHKRKTPVTSPVEHPSSSSTQATRTVIRRFHVLIKRQTQLQQSIHNQRREDVVATELADIERQIQELGGLAAYQRMSTIGQGKDRGGGSEKVLMDWMRDMRLHEQASEKHRTNPDERSRLRLLEVGALKPDNYAACHAWLDVTPIDLHSQHPSILEQDFLLMDAQEHRESWDIISLSLVLNFVPNAKDRSEIDSSVGRLTYTCQIFVAGRMLSLAHTMLRPDGLLFIALPLPCILNSRYLTPEHFQGLMTTVGFDQIHSRWKTGGKMAYWLFRRTKHAASTTYQTHMLYEKKTVFRQGDRNNFVILL